MPGITREFAQLLVRDLPYGRLPVDALAFEMVDRSGLAATSLLGEYKHGHHPLPDRDREMMRRRTKAELYRSHEEATIESLRADPALAAKYLNSVLEDGSEQELMLAMRRLADAMGGVPKLASRTKLNVTTLYRTLSKKGNPELRSMNSMLKALGLRLAVQPIGKSS